MICSALGPPHEWCCGVCHERGGRAYIRCYECGHPYRTRWHLLLAYWREHTAIWWRCRRDNPGRWWHVLPGWWRPSTITFCQCCTHDF